MSIISDANSAFLALEESGHSDVHALENEPVQTTGTPPTDVLAHDVLLAELYAEALQRAEARASGEPLGAEVAAISPRLHDAVGEALPVGMTTLDGGPGAGKTALALQIAMTCRIPALIVECEVRLVRILERMTAFHTRTYLGRFKDGTLLPETIRDLAAQTLRDLPMVALMDATAQPRSMALIARAAVALRDQHGAKHVLVVLDSFHAWTIRNVKAESEYDRLTRAIQQIDGAAKTNNLAVIAVLERSLGSMRSPSATSGKGHAGIGYAGEIAINLDTEGALGHRTGTQPVTMTISKNRHGSQGFTIPMTFEGRLQRFSEAVDTDPFTEVLDAMQGHREQEADEPDPLLDEVTNEDDLPTLEEYLRAST